MVCTGLQWAHQQQAFDLKQYKFDAIILHSIQLHQIGLRHLRHSGTCKQNSFQGKQLEAPVQSPQWLPDVEWISSRNSSGSKQQQLDAEILVKAMVDGKREEITWQNSVQESNFYFLLERHVDFFFCNFICSPCDFLVTHLQPTNIPFNHHFTQSHTNQLTSLSAWQCLSLYSVMKNPLQQEVCYSVFCSVSLLVWHS